MTRRLKAKDRDQDGLVEGHRLIAEHFRTLKAKQRAERWTRFKQLPWYRKLAAACGFALMGLGAVGLFVSPRLLIFLPAIPFILGALIVSKLTGDDWVS